MTNSLPAFMWYRAASAGYAKPHDWQAWADERIAASQQIPDWLIDLSLAGDIDRMLSATEPERARECGIPGWADDESVLGYLVLRLRSGEVELNECLDQCVELACQFDFEDDCNYFCTQLSQLVADHPKHVAAAEAPAALCASGRDGMGAAQGVNAGPTRRELAVKASPQNGLLRAVALPRVPFGLHLQPARPLGARVPCWRCGLVSASLQVVSAD